MSAIDQLSDFFSGLRSGASRPGSHGKRSDIPLNLNRNERLVSGAGGGALVLAGLRRGGPAGALIALAGGALLARGISGHCGLKAKLAPSTEEQLVAAEMGWDAAATVGHTAIIQRPIAEVYAFCRDFRNLPQFMEHLKRVEIRDDRHSHWVIDAPFNQTLEWDTIITEDRPNERIAWESDASASLRHAGWLQFSDVTGVGTEVQAFIAFEPPAGEVGRMVVKLWGDRPNAQASGTLQRLKQFLEAGEHHANANASVDGD